MNPKMAARRDGAGMDRQTRRARRGAVRAVALAGGVALIGAAGITTATTAQAATVTAAVTRAPLPAAAAASRVAVASAPAALAAITPQGAIGQGAGCTGDLGASVTCTLTARPTADITAGGATAHVWSFVGSAGGTELNNPTIVATAGQQVTINVTNNLPTLSQAFPLSLAIPGMAGIATDYQGADAGATASVSFTPQQPGTYIYQAGHILRRDGNGAFSGRRRRPPRGRDGPGGRPHRPAVGLRDDADGLRRRQPDAGQPVRRRGGAAAHRRRPRLRGGAGHLRPAQVQRDDPAHQRQGLPEHRPRSRRARAARSCSGTPTPASSATPWACSVPARAWSGSAATPPPARGSSPTRSRPARPRTRSWPFRRPAAASWPSPTRAAASTPTGPPRVHAASSSSAACSPSSPTTPPPWRPTPSGRTRRSPASRRAPSPPRVTSP